MQYDYTILGGDLRQVYIGDLLVKKGFRVAVWGGVGENTDSLADAMDAEVLISAIPFSKDGLHVNTEKGNREIPLAEVKRLLKSTQRLYAGCIPTKFAHFCEEAGVFTYDFMQDNNLALYNTIATAEGAIAEALFHQPTNLHRSNCLILGYGKCAKVLAKKLRGLEAKVTVCARNEEDLSLADAFGYDTLQLSKWREKLPAFEYVFNTVPSVILQKDTLRRMHRDVIIIDIASAPGGVDYEAAEELGINAFLVPGLPGKYAPKDTAEALTKLVLQREEV